MCAFLVSNTLLQKKEFTVYLVVIHSIQFHASFLSSHCEIAVKSYLENGRSLTKNKKRATNFRYNFLLFQFIVLAALIIIFIQVFLCWCIRSVILHIKTNFVEKERCRRCRIKIINFVCCFP